MREDGISSAEIGQRIGRSEAHVDRIIEWTTIPRNHPPRRRSPRPIERRVLALRAAGESHERVAARFKRSPRFIRQVEGLAHYRLGLGLLTADRAEEGGTR
jgi:hypothetical protein